jgi:hypothetical protein
MGDYAESKLFKLIEQGNQRAIEFYLSSCHRRRGYGVLRGEADVDDQPRRITEVIWRVIGSPAATQSPGDAAVVIDHQAIEDGRIAEAG